MQEDVPFARFVLLRRRAFKKFRGAKIEMNSIVFKVVVVLAALCCATADFQCNSSVGLESKEVPDRLIDASSYRRGHYAYLGRLNNEVRKINETKTVWGAWCSRTPNRNQYIQVDLEHVRNVTGVATQGYDYGAAVSLYKIMYSINGKQWFNYKENNTDKIFKGNQDRDTIVQHEFNRRLAARFIRFNPWAWQGMICMRVEIYACIVPRTKVTTTVATTTESPTTKKKVIDVGIIEVLETDAKTTEKPREHQELSTSMPMDYTTFDDRTNASSQSFCSFSLLLACITYLLLASK